MKIYIHTPYITIQQLLKLTNVIDTGGKVKFFLQNNTVYINGNRTITRGKKLYAGDVVTVNNLTLVITDENNEN